MPIHGVRYPLAGYMSALKRISPVGCGIANMEQLSH